MKFTINSDILKQKIKTIEAAVPRQATHAILNCIKLVVHSDSIRLTAFDLSLGIETECLLDYDLTIESEGAYLIPFKEFKKFLMALKKAPISFEVRDEEVEEQSLLEVYTDDSKAIFPFFGTGDDYPRLPPVIDGQILDVDYDGLTRGVEFCRNTKSNDQTKLALTGIHFKIKDNILSVAATDGHRLALFNSNQQLSMPDTESEKELEESDTELDLTEAIAEKSKQEVSLTLKDVDLVLNTLKNTVIDEFKLEFSDDRASITVKENGNTTKFTFSVLSSTYPNYAQLIPNTFTTEIEIDRTEFIESLGVVSSLATIKTPTVRVSFLANEEFIALDLHSKTEFASSKCHNYEYLKEEGEDLEIGFNCHYLREGLKLFSEHKITMYLNKPTQPVIFKKNKDDSELYLIMPVQLKD